MPRLHLSALTPEQMLDAALGERAEVIARPRPTPREVLAAWLGNFGVGIGGGIAAGVALYVAGAPETALWSGSLLTGATVFAGMMIWYGSQDERADWRNVRRIKRAVKAIEAHHASKAERLQAQLTKALDALDEADATEAQLRRALDRMTTERDSAILEKKRALEQAQSANSRTFVRASNTSAQVVSDAHEILRYWFESNGEKWYSRNVANSFGWSDKRHRAAQQLLVDSGVVVINEKRPRVMEATLDEALRSLNDHVARVDSVFPLDVHQPAWQEDE